MTDLHLDENLPLSYRGKGGNKQAASCKAHVTSETLLRAGEFLPTAASSDNNHRDELTHQTKKLEGDSSPPADGAGIICEDVGKELRQGKTAPLETLKRPLDEKSCPTGSRLMLKMGWRQGDGLGKDGAGIKTPITTAVKTSFGTEDTTSQNPFEDGVSGEAMAKATVEAWGRPIVKTWNEVVVETLSGTNKEVNDSSNNVSTEHSFDKSDKNAPPQLDDIVATGGSVVADLTKSHPGTSDAWNAFSKANETLAGRFKTFVAATSTAATSSPPILRQDNQLSGVSVQKPRVVSRDIDLSAYPQASQSTKSPLAVAAATTCVMQSHLTRRLPSTTSTLRGPW
jgi:hypothetical protein